MRISFSLFTDTGSRDVNEDYTKTAENGEAKCFVLPKLDKVLEQSEER